MRKATPRSTRAKKAVRFTASVEVTERAKLLEFLLVDHDGLDPLGADPLVEAVPFACQPVAQLRDERPRDVSLFGQLLFLGCVGVEIVNLERALLEMVN